MPVPLPGDGELTELPVPPLPPRAFGDSVLPLLSTKGASIFVRSRNERVEREIRVTTSSIRVEQENQERESLSIAINKLGSL